MSWFDRGDAELERIVGAVRPIAGRIYDHKRHLTLPPMSEWTERGEARGPEVAPAVTKAMTPRSTELTAKLGQDYDADGFGARVWRWLTRAWR